ncbi:hypothetical protein N9N67_11735, partial [Bacteriovoracaceae bacterium]|nr:hypothetical protein [Bacteriovoracaceae bacterium]
IFGGEGFFYTLGSKLYFNPDSNSWSHFFLKDYNQEINLMLKKDIETLILATNHYLYTDSILSNEAGLVPLNENPYSSIRSIAFDGSEYYVLEDMDVFPFDTPFFKMPSGRLHLVNAGLSFDLYEHIGGFLDPNQHVESGNFNFFTGNIQVAAFEGKIFISAQSNTTNGLYQFRINSNNQLVLESLSSFPSTLMRVDQLKSIQNGNSHQIGIIGYNGSDDFPLMRSFYLLDSNLDLIYEEVLPHGNELSTDVIRFDYEPKFKRSFIVKQSSFNHHVGSVYRYSFTGNSNYVDENIFQYTNWLNFNEDYRLVVGGNKQSWTEEGYHGIWSGSNINPCDEEGSIDLFSYATHVKAVQDYNTINHITTGTSFAAPQAAAAAALVYDYAHQLGIELQIGEVQEIVLNNLVEFNPMIYPNCTKGEWVLDFSNFSQELFE